MICKMFPLGTLNDYTYPQIKTKLFAHLEEMGKV